MSATTVPTTTLRICVDCLMLLANGELGGYDPGEQLARQHAARMNRVWGDDEITLGCVDEDCADDGEECGFSWASCDGCGSELGGDRYHATGWVAP